jgi:hypothetical protein
MDLADQQSVTTVARPPTTEHYRDYLSAVAGKQMALQLLMLSAC